ncbi:MAG: hypothetical protein IPJ69_04475 [Deltaproteobacteria bacterium]|nr:MAG: hypothetical protein IPJ69_04475 [Deltaproteobacteria bacterium]
MKGIGSFGDFVLYSPHKHLPIPDGAVLVVRSSGPSQLSEGQINSFGLPNLWPKQLQKFQEQMGLHRNRHWVRPMIWLIKRILQKLGIRSWRKKSEPFIDASTIKPIQLSQFSEPDLSFLSKRLLGSILLDMEQVSKRRQHNQALWDKVLFQSSISNKIVPAERPIENEWLPYLAAYKTEFSTALEIYEYLESKNFPVTSWPDLPPEVNMNREFHNRAWNLRHTRFYLPIHQSLNEKEIFSLYL